MTNTTAVSAAILGAFVLYISARNTLPVYLGIFGLGGSSPASSSASPPSASGVPSDPVTDNPPGGSVFDAIQKWLKGVLGGGPAAGTSGQSAVPAPNTSVFGAITGMGGPALSDGLFDIFR